MSKRLSAVALRRISRKDQNILNAAQKASVECVKYERTEIALGNKKNTVGREYTRPTVNKCFLLQGAEAQAPRSSGNDKADLATLTKSQHLTNYFLPKNQ